MHNYVSLKQLNPKSADKLSIPFGPVPAMYRLWQEMDRVAHLQAKTSELERRQVSEFDA